MLFRPLLALTALAALASCDKAAAAKADAASAPRVEGDWLVLPADDPSIPALATTPAVAAEGDSLTLTGRLVWNEDATVRMFSPFGGRVTRVIGTVGRVVHAGDTLAVIASADFGQAQADARKAQTDFDLATRNAARALDLFQHGVAAKKDVEAADGDLARARAERERAVARLRLYGGDSSDIDQSFVLRAPIGGTIVDRSVAMGQEVRPDQMLANAPQLFAPLFTVTDPSRLWVILDVPERDLPRISPRAAISVRANAWPGRVFGGQLTLVGDAVDPNTRTVKLRGSVENARGILKSEMLVSVTVSAGRVAGVSIPTSGVLLEGTSHVVFIDEGRGRYRRAEVTLGNEHAGRIEIVSGVAAGDRVVTAGVPLVEQLFQNTKTQS